MNIHFLLESWWNGSIEIVLKRKKANNKSSKRANELCNSFIESSFNVINVIFIPNCGVMNKPLAISHCGVMNKPLAI